MKLLTIAMPSYNVEKYIRKGLDSMVGIDSRLEIIVVNDGSVDSTEQIVQEYVDKYPDQVRLINKENGGHGSGINAAMQQATGRYFKVIDSDDWIISDNLVPLLDRLEKTDADAVLTAYHTVHMVSGNVIAYPCQCKYADQEINMTQLMEVFPEVSACCTFHGLMYRTEMYRNAGIRLSEGVFYEDQEYSTLPFAHVEKVLILPIYFYQYLIGNGNQSVAFHNQVKRISHLETVLRHMLSYRAAHAPLSDDAEAYFMNHLSVVATSYFATALVKNPDRKSGAQDAERIKAMLESDAPELMARIAKKYQILMTLHRVRFPVGLYQWFLDTNIYSNFRKRWMK